MNLISSPLPSQASPLIFFFCGFPALEKMISVLECVCVFMCTVPSPSLAGTSRELILALFVEGGRHSATVCSSENISCGKRQQTGGSPGEVRGLAHVTLQDRLRLLGLFGLHWRLNCSLPFGSLQRRQSQTLLEDAQGKDKSQQLQLSGKEIAAS